MTASHVLCGGLKVWLVVNTPMLLHSLTYTPNYPHKNNADNSIKIAFTNSKLPKIIRTLVTSGHLKKYLEETDERAGKGWHLTAPWKLSALFWNCVHKSGPDAAIMRIIAASKKYGLLWLLWITPPPPPKTPTTSPITQFIFCFVLQFQWGAPPPPPIEITPLVISMINSTNNKFIRRLYLELCLEVWSMMRHHKLRTRLILPPFTPPSPVPAFRRGPVCRGQFGEVLSFLRPTIQTIIKCPRLPGTITVEWFFAVRTGFALGHRASTFHACAHLITTAVRYQLRAQGRYFVPEPNMVGGVTGRSPGERPHDGIAGESPA